MNEMGAAAVVPPTGRFLVLSGAEEAGIRGEAVVRMCIREKIEGPGKREERGEQEEGQKLGR